MFSVLSVCNPVPHLFFRSFSPSLLLLYSYAARIKQKARFTDMNINEGLCTHYDALKQQQPSSLYLPSQHAPVHVCVAAGVN